MCILTRPEATRPHPLIAWNKQRLAKRGWRANWRSEAADLATFLILIIVAGLGFFSAHLLGFNP